MKVNYTITDNQKFIDLHSGIIVLNEIVSRLKEFGDDEGSITDEEASEKIGSAVDALSSLKERMQKRMLECREEVV